MRTKASRRLAVNCFSSDAICVFCEKTVRNISSNLPGIGIGKAGAYGQTPPPCHLSAVESPLAIKAKSTSTTAAVLSANRELTLGGSDHLPSLIESSATEKCFKHAKSSLCRALSTPHGCTYAFKVPYCLVRGARERRVKGEFLHSVALRPPA